MTLAYGIKQDSPRVSKKECEPSRLQSSAYTVEDLELLGLNTRRAASRSKRKAVDGAGQGSRHSKEDSRHSGHRSFRGVLRQLHRHGQIPVRHRHIWKASLLHGSRAVDYPDYPEYYVTVQQHQGRAKSVS